MTAERRLAMRHRAFITAAAVAITLLAFGRTAQAQEAYAFKIPFAFFASGKVFPAGDYRFVVNNSQEYVRLEAGNVRDGAVMLPVETRIADQTGPGDPELVFDKLKGALYVSELLVPGDDGYLIWVAKTEHSHQLLAGNRVKR
jgi:hypothetical protein